MQVFSRSAAQECYTKPVGFSTFDKNGVTVFVPHGPFEPEVFFYHVMEKAEALDRGLAEDDDDDFIVMGTNMDMYCTEPYMDFETMAEALEYCEEQAMYSSERWHTPL